MFSHPLFHDSFMPLVTPDDVPGPGHSLAMDVEGGSAMGSWESLDSLDPRAPTPSFVIVFDGPGHLLGTRSP